MNIQQIILEGLTSQLHVHDYLVLPDFGGFVLKYRPAHYSPAGGQLMPPSKTVSFNAQLKQNDGNLVRWLCQRTGMDAPTAERQLLEFTAYCKGVLQGKRRLSIPGIGFFFLDFEDNLGFEPEPARNFLKESFGLESVQAGEIVKRPIQRSTQFVDRSLSTSQHERKKQGNRRSPVLPVATLVMSVITFCVLLLVVSSANFKGLLYASAWSGETQSKYTPIAYGELKLAEVPAEDPLVTDNQGLTSFQFGNSRLTAELDHVSAAPEASKRYDIVLGCFSKKENARKMVRMMRKQQIEANISSVQQKGLIVVSFGPFKSMNSANEELSRVQSVLAEAWVREF